MFHPEESMIWEEFAGILASYGEYAGYDFSAVDLVLDPQAIVSRAQQRPRSMNFWKRADHCRLLTFQRKEAVQKIQAEAARQKVRRKVEAKTSRYRNSTSRRRRQRQYGAMVRPHDILPLHPSRSPCKPTSREDEEASEPKMI